MVDQNKSNIHDKIKRLLVPLITAYGFNPDDIDRFEDKIIRIIKLEVLTEFIERYSFYYGFEQCRKVTQQSRDHGDLNSLLKNLTQEYSQSEIDKIVQHVVKRTMQDLLQFFNQTELEKLNQGDLVSGGNRLAGK